MSDTAQAPSQIPAPAESTTQSTSTQSTSTTAPTMPPSPLTATVAFFESVFSGTNTETPDQQAAIAAVITAAIGPGYEYNGQPASAAGLIAWRTALMARNKQMSYIVSSVLSGPVDQDPTNPMTAVATQWTWTKTDLTGATFALRGMNFVGIQKGQVTANTQFGNAKVGWRPVTS